MHTRLQLLAPDLLYCAGSSVMSDVHVHISDPNF